jgi:hypothetical protein
MSFSILLMEKKQVSILRGVYVWQYTFAASTGDTAKNSFAKLELMTYHATSHWLISLQPPLREGGKQIN